MTTGRKGSTLTGNGLSAEHGLFPAGHIIPFLLVTALFFLWGVPNNLE